MLKILSPLLVILALVSFESAYGQTCLQLLTGKSEQGQAPQEKTKLWGRIKDAILPFKKNRLHQLVENPTNEKIAELTDTELTDYLNLSFPGFFYENGKKVESSTKFGKGVDRQRAYRAGLRELLKRLDHESIESDFIIRSFNDLLRFGLFEIRDESLVSIQPLQGNNLSAFAFELSSTARGLSIRGINGSTTYFSSPGQRRSWSTLWGYVGRNPSREGSPQDYLDIGSFVSFSKEAYFEVIGSEVGTQGEEGFIDSYSDFKRMNPKVFWVHPTLMKKTRREFMEWISSHQSPQRESHP